MKVTGIAAASHRLTEAVETARRALAEDVASRLRAATPVDTGRARDGWTIEESPGPQTHIRNDVPYVGRLNDGGSAQAPAGFVERALSEALEDF